MEPWSAFEFMGGKMYRYEFVEENVSTFLAAGNKNHRAVCGSGFRYAGYIPTSYSTGGLPKAFDLIFEKEEQD